MERADKTSAPLRQAAAERTVAHGPDLTLVEHCPATIAQRKLIDSIRQSPKGQAGRAASAGIQDSPRLVAQRAQLTGLFPAEHGRALAKTAPASSTGMHLPGTLQRKYESSLGVDLSGVRLHTGPVSQESAAAIGARAYATGQDIHFAKGQYQPRSSAGEHLLAHEVAHTVQQGAGPATAQRQLEVSNPGDALEAEANKAADAMTAGRPGAVSAGCAIAARTVQRKVGFELEDRDWRAYIEEKKDIRPAKRQELLYPGRGFDLEADDSMGPKLPSLEFVTVPFEPTAQGIANLNTAFNEIRAITAHIGQYAPIDNPFESERNKPPKSKEFLTPKKHGLNKNVLLAGGVPDAKFKMQATQGVSLEDLPTVMQTFGSNAPNETLTEKAERDPARELMYGEPKQATGKNQPASDLFAAAPSLAVQVIDELRHILFSPPKKKERKPRREKEKEEAHTLPSQDTQPVEQDIVIEAEEGRTEGEAAEGIETKEDTHPELVPRLETKPESSPRPERKHKRAHKLRDNLGALIDAIVKVANAKQFIAIEQMSPKTLKQEIVLHDTNFGAGVPLVRHPDFGLTSLTLGLWLKGMVNGVETLNPAAITSFLGRESKTASTALESFAVLGRKTIEPSIVTDDEDIKGHSRLGIFENRMIAGPKGFFTATAAHGAALNYLTYYKNLKDGMGVPGAFPTLGAPPQQIVEKTGKKEKK